LGFDFLSKKTEHKGKTIELEVWDTAGQEQYRAVTKMYYKDVHGVVLVYDTTDRTSFEKAKFWLDDLEMHGNKMEEKILVGSKMDLSAKREVTLYEAKKFAGERKLEWTECSAKTGEGVNEMFDMLLEKIIYSYDHNEEFRNIFCRSTIVSVGPPISEEDAKHRQKSYKLSKSNLDKKKKDGCC